MDSSVVFVFDFIPEPIKDRIGDEIGCYCASLP